MQKMPPAFHKVSATSLKLLIQQIHPHVRVERDSGMCVARDLLRTVGPEPLHPHVCGPHVALEVGDHLMLFTIRSYLNAKRFVLVSTFEKTKTVLCNSNTRLMNRKGALCFGENINLS
jgi:hypothetical protein